MSYNKKELMSLPAEEKLALVEELWDSIDEELMPITDQEIAFLPKNV